MGGFIVVYYIVFIIIGVVYDRKGVLSCGFGCLSV